jgi:hypothetical protein
MNVLSRPFVHFVSANLPQKARDHFYGLREAKPDLRGIAIFDRLDKELADTGSLVERCWRQREIENYFCIEEVLLNYARHDLPDDLFNYAEASRRIQAMEEAIREVTQALETLGNRDGAAWSPDIKSTDEFLDPLFKRYFAKLGLPILLRKTDYHQLARLLPKERIEPEINIILNEIVAVSEQAVSPEE